LQLFRAISSLNEKHVKELMLKAGLNEWLEVFPEELRDEAQAIYDEIQARFTTRRERIMKDFAAFWSPDRKTFALSVVNNPERSFLFRLYDKQDIDTKLLLDC
jgi:hypothetical protein